MYNRYRLSQINYLRQHYANQPASHFAQLWNITPSQVYDLARAHDITKRAPNGAPTWRQAA